MSDTYRLVLPTDDIDLARHVRDVAYWKRPAGTVISGSRKATWSDRRSSDWSKVKGPKGAHLYSPTEDKGKDVTAVAAKIDEQVKHAASLDPDSPEYRKAWTDVAVHLDTLSARAKAAQKTEPKAIETAKEGVKGFGEHLTIGGALIPGLIAAGTNAAGAAAGLLGAEESHHFAESFERLSHNFYVEAGLWVGLALLLHTLAVRIVAALKKRKAKKIEKARALKSSEHWTS